MGHTPYSDQGDASFWKRSIAQVAPSDVDPAGPLGFTIDKDTRIMSAGSCFAANVTRYLVYFGYNYLFKEKLHPFFFDRDPNLAKQVGLGEYSAGYGNIYTPAQMAQLIKRAYGTFSPAEDRWAAGDGSIIDPFRPRIQQRAADDREFEALRAQHFKAVREAIEDAEVLIFTYGLTEAWRSREDGAVFPVCPGAVGGTFDPQKHEFVNYTVGDIISDTEEVLGLLKEKNPDIKVILTVSPVPLVATATQNHVLSATTYSKSVLRVAAQTIADTHDNVGYFPAYEIITGAHAQYDVFEPNRRSVAKKGVDQVMRMFFRHIANDDKAEQDLASSEIDVASCAAPAPANAGRPASLGEAIAEAECEEELLEITSRK